MALTTEQKAQFEKDMEHLHHTPVEFPDEEHMKTMSVHWKTDSKLCMHRLKIKTFQSKRICEKLRVRTHDEKADESANGQHEGISTPDSNQNEHDNVETVVDSANSPDVKDDECETSTSSSDRNDSLVVVSFVFFLFFNI